MNPEVFALAQREVEMALLKEYDTVAQEIPYAIGFSAPINLVIKDFGSQACTVWDLADSTVMAWARNLPDDEFHELKVTCFFEDGRAVVPVSVTRANGRGFSLMGAFFEMVLDRTSPAKI